MNRGTFDGWGCRFGFEAGSCHRFQRPLRLHSTMEAPLKSAFSNGKIRTLVPSLAEEESRTTLPKKPLRLCASRSSRRHPMRNVTYRIENFDHNGTGVEVLGEVDLWRLSITCQKFSQLLRHLINKFIFTCHRILLSFRHAINKMASNDYIGRVRERQEFDVLLRKKQAQLVTCQGRRRVGKSRFVGECAQKAAHFISLTGLAPREGITKAEQLEAFVDRLSRQTKLPKLTLESWPEAFQLLVSQLPARGKLVVLLDEVSWMAIGDKDFAGHLKTAWDEEFSQRDGLVMVLCGSVSSWIKKNILKSAGFVGRCSWHFRLKPLSLAESVAFWGKRGQGMSLREKLNVMAVTGGVPGYLREIDPKQSAETNVERLCFNPGGMLFHEFERIFHDTFLRRAESYREIVGTLVTGPKTIQQVSKALGRERGGSLGDALEELEQAGFISKEVNFDPATGKDRPRGACYRLADNYLRFYLKYVEPVRGRVEKSLYQRVPLESLEAWDTIMGLQFETMILGSREAVYERLGLDRVVVLNAGPYAQKQTQRRRGCQIDLLIRTKASIYIVEFKLRKTIDASVMDEVREKVKRLSLPQGSSVRTVLIYNGDLAKQVVEADYFDFLVPVEELI